MELAKEELLKSLKYHSRQLEDNERKIQSNIESNQMLTTANDKHRQYISELTSLLQKLED